MVLWQEEAMQRLGKLQVEIMSYLQENFGDKLALEQELMSIV